MEDIGKEKVEKARRQGVETVDKAANYTEDILESAKAEGEKTWQKVKTKSQDIWDDVSYKGQQTWKSTRSYIQESPAQALGIAAAIGLVFGLWLASGKKESK